MTSDLINRIVTFLVFLVVQVLVLNHIHLFGVATPLLYVYFVLLFRRNHPKWAILMWSFFLGLCIDVFSNTPGVAAGSMTLVALFQPYVLEPFLTRDSEDNLKPGCVRWASASLFSTPSSWCFSIRSPFSHWRPSISSTGCSGCCASLPAHCSRLCLSW